MKRSKLTSAAALIINIAVPIMVFFAIAEFFAVGGSSPLGEYRWGCFKFFTIDSNVAAAISSIVLDICILRHMNDGGKYGKALFFLRIFGVASVAVTFITVMVFLGPLMGYREMLSGGNLWLHLICPLLEIASFIFFEGYVRVSTAEALFGMLPVVIYGALYVVMVLIIGPENGG